MHPNALLTDPRRCVYISGNSAKALTSLPDNTRLPENGAKRGNKSGNGKNIKPLTSCASVLACAPFGLPVSFLRHEIVLLCRLSLSREDLTY
jgi:hypothetical protein